MSTTPPLDAAVTTSPARPGELPLSEGAFGWLRDLGPRGRRAFGGAFGGYALDPAAAQVPPGTPVRFVPAAGR
ncbi:MULTISPECIES: hypothetical protein [Streptomyces]|uniref:hypothetical protein n=1 Tax=Streptomyces TaxID=1883 RepID=UPI002DDB2BE0|nr:MULTISPECIES: hypothetical protein [unclassified Streptomyces]WSD99495.1 hypothetical protein OG758_38215 [Streptomyces sp. NBC_01474]